MWQLQSRLLLLLAPGLFRGAIYLGFSSSDFDVGSSTAEYLGSDVYSCSGNFLGLWHLHLVFLSPSTFLASLGLVCYLRVASSFILGLAGVTCVSGPQALSPSYHLCLLDGFGGSSDPG